LIDTDIHPFITDSNAINAHANLANVHIQPNLVNEYNLFLASIEANGNPANNVDRYK
jgi:hypothetical protein